MPASKVSCPCTVRGCRGKLVDSRTAQRHAARQHGANVDDQMDMVAAVELPSSSPPTPSPAPPTPSAAAATSGSATPSTSPGALGEDDGQRASSSPPLSVTPRSPPSSSRGSQASQQTEDSGLLSLESLGPVISTLDPGVLYEGTRVTQGLDPRLPHWLVELYWLLLSLRSHHGVPVVAIERLLRFARDRLLPEFGLNLRSPVRLPTIRKRLGLDSDEAIRYVVCPNQGCQLLSPPLLSVSGTTTCDGCETALLGHDGAPQVEFHYSPLQHWLQCLVRRPDFLDDINLWRTRSTPSVPAGGSPPLLADIYDGTAWQAERPFLDATGVNLLLGLGMDWFQPFEGPRSYSAGPIFLSVLNLLSSQRFSPEFVHLAGITPGPREPSHHTVHAFLEPLLLELLTLQDGIDVEVPLASDSSAHSPSGSTATRTLRLRAKLLLFVGDSPARSRVGGFNSIGAKQQFCPYCDAALDDKEEIALGHKRARPRDPRRDSLAVRGRGAAAQTRMAKTTGARYAILHELPYWYSVTSCPVDVMHALYLGIVKRLWRHFLLAYGLIRRDELDWIRSLLANARIPFVLERPPPGIGGPEGGTPTANQLATLARLLPALLMTPWWESILHYQAHRRQVQQQMADDVDILDRDKARPHWVFVDATRADPSERRGHLHRFVHRGWIFEEIVVRLCVVVEYLSQKVLDSADVDFLQRQLHLLVRAIATLPFMTFNTHVMTHAANHIRRFGPPRAFWAFVMEKHIQVLGRVTPATNKRQIELTMLKNWSDRDHVESSDLAPDHDASGTALSVRARERQRTYDGSIQTEELGHHRSGGPQRLSVEAYRSLYAALLRRYPSVRFAKADGQPVPPGFVAVINSVEPFDAVSINGLHFTAHARATQDLLQTPPTSFAFVRHQQRGSAEARLHPVQIVMIFTHVHRPRATRPSTTTATFALCRVFRTAPPPTWFHSPGSKPFAGFSRVSLEADAQQLVFGVDALVGSAVVIPLAPPSALFKMVL